MSLQDTLSVRATKFCISTGVVHRRTSNVRQGRSPPTGVLFSLEGRWPESAAGLRGSLRECSEINSGTRGWKTHKVNE